MKKALCFILALAISSVLFVVPALAASDFDPCYGRTAYSLWVRSGPGVGYDSLFYVNYGTDVIILGESGNWYQIAYTANGQNDFGYAEKDDVDIIYRGWTTDDLNVRSSAYVSEFLDNIVGQFDEFQEIYCIGEASDDGWYKVEGADEFTNSRISGYSSAEFITIIGVYEYKGNLKFPANLDGDSESSSAESSDDPYEDSSSSDNDYVTGIIDNSKDYDYSLNFGADISETESAADEKESSGATIAIILVVVGVLLLLALPLIIFILIIVLIVSAVKKKKRKKAAAAEAAAAAAAVNEPVVYEPSAPKPVTPAAEKPAVTEPEAPAAAPQKENAQPETTFCANCGNQFPKNFAFCPNCGFKKG